MCVCVCVRGGEGGGDDFSAAFWEAPLDQIRLLAKRGANVTNITRLHSRLHLTIHRCLQLLFCRAGYRRTLCAATNSHWERASLS